LARRRKKKRTLKSKVRQNFFGLLLFFVLLGWASTYAVTWPGFRPHGVSINGAHIVSTQQIRELANIDLDTNVWTINPWAIDRRIEMIPYIDRAHVHRSLPNIIRIDVTERRPESCVEGAQHAVMTIDATQRVLNEGCKAAPVYNLPAIVGVKPGVVLNDPQLARLRATAAELVTGGVHLKSISIDRDLGTIIDRADGVRLLLGDDTDLQAKIRLINPIMAAARTHDPNIQLLDLRAVDTPVVRYRESQRNAQNRPAQ
jgi:cell division septal protein FtsQ